MNKLTAATPTKPRQLPQANSTKNQHVNQAKAAAREGGFFMQGAKAMKTTNAKEIRKEIVRMIRDELQKVDEQLETYIPEAVILEGSSLTIRITLDELTAVHADFKHMA